MLPIDHRDCGSLNADLLKLQREACRYPAGHVQRQLRLTRIIRQVTASGRLWHESSPYYEDALQLTWLYFCQNICEAGSGAAYDATRGSILTWLNRYLKWRLRDLAAAHHDQLKQVDLSQIHEPVGLEVPPILEEVRSWAESDPELVQIYIQDRPDLNCRRLILERLPPEQSWKQLSAQFNISISTLSSFYQRQCLPRLHKFGQFQGYL
ncbi:sigma-70 family RNA polymerase sigma factor [Lyngbya confervoides]|uniref:Sigma-70 family RNA polymerase sigma factor n=1 Tax=Lyngbya confervoides BDU141951 TaxID=1574623 RepID=A0ABD4TAA6_9CYAN|nr:sigma-70 family RNA polymerase sigma factor [Lyngbya confervoides]MCM1985349.1 sigma-70 family RNA polymerase sigma factor [Lyngbya confervoides BDU141951]